jgi:hypothetical protein
MRIATVGVSACCARSPIPVSADRPPNPLWSKTASGSAPYASPLTDVGAPGNQPYTGAKLGIRVRWH